MKRYLQSALLGAALFGAGTAAASAEIIYALAGDKTILRIDTETAQLLGSVEVNNGPAVLASIDVRPSNGSLYGLFTNGRLATINPITGRARLGPVIRGFDFTRGSYDINFNPVVDLLRIVGVNDANLRVNVDDGALTTDSPITGPQPNPFGDTSTRITAVAYTNSFGSPTDGTAPKATQLYAIDREPEALYLQVPPNNGTLSAVGPIGINLVMFGFDISARANSRNRGWIVANNRLFEIDLGGGATISDRPVQGLARPVRDITVAVPTP